MRLVQSLLSTHVYTQLCGNLAYTTVSLINKNILSDHVLSSSYPTCDISSQMGPGCRLISNRSLQRSALLGWGRMQGLNGSCSPASSSCPAHRQQHSHSAHLPCSAVSCTVQAMPTQPSLPGSMPLPLSSRPADREESFNALLEWQQHFSAQLHAIGDTWLEQDDGPSGDQLQVWSSPDVLMQEKRDWLKQ